MHSMIMTATLATALFSAAIPASSQTYNRPGREVAPDGYITLQSNVTLSLPYAEGEKIDGQVEAAQQTLYNLAARQCSVVLSTIATECRISSLSTTVNSQRIQRDFPQITITAQIGMAVKLK